MQPSKRAKQGEGGRETRPPDKRYIVQKIQERKIVKYGVEEYVCRAKFNDVLEKQNIANVKDDLLAMFDEVLKAGTASYPAGQKIRVSVEHHSLDKPMTIHLQPRENITPEVILSR